MPRIIHISTHYYPVNGGQQIYIESFKAQFPEYEHVVVQIGVEGTSYPTGVIPIYVPKRYQVGAIPFYYFNWKLRAEMEASGAVDFERDIALCHYAFHYRAARCFANRIVLSHGVEWDGPGSVVRKLYHRHRKHISLRALNDRSCRLVANDMNFFRALGFNEISADYAFREVLANKWLIPNAVDTARFSPPQGEGFRFPTPAVVIPRNIVPQRGIDTVIRAFAECRSRLNGHKLYIVGSRYDANYYASLEALIRQLGIEQDVVFWGSVAHVNMPDIYRAADAVVIFSLFREGTSLAALEAMACGTPVVTSAVGGLVDLPSLKANASTLGETIVRAVTSRVQIGDQQLLCVRNGWSIDRWREAWRRVLESITTRTENGGIE